MFALLISVIIVVALLLILVVLAQNSKGGGLSSQFGGSGAGQLMGVKKTTDLLEKLTWGFAIALVVLSLATNLLLEPRQAGPAINSPNLDRAQEQTILPGFENVGEDNQVPLDESTDTQNPSLESLDNTEDPQQ